MLYQPGPAFKMALPAAKVASVSAAVALFSFMSALSSGGAVSLELSVGGQSRGAWDGFQSMMKSSCA